MQIAVTGANGFVGKNIIENLIESDHKVRAIVRNEKNGVDGCQNFIADVTKPQSLDGAFDKCDIVIHLVGIIRGSRKDFENIVNHGTRNVLDECKKSNIKKIVYLSAIGAGESDIDYFRTKDLAEKYITNSKIPYLILRPSVIYGKGGEFLSLIRRLIDFPITPIMGDGTYQMQPILVKDVSRCVAYGIENNIEGTIEIAGPEKMSFAQMLDIIAKSDGKKLRKLFIPLQIAKIMVWVSSPFWFTPLTKDQLKMMLKGSTCDLKQMVELLKISPIRLEDGLKEC